MNKVKYKISEDLSAEEKKELGLSKDVRGLIAIITIVEDGKTKTIGQPIDSITDVMQEEQSSSACRRIKDSSNMQKAGDKNMLKEIEDSLPEIVKERMKEVNNSLKTGEPTPFNPEFELHMLLQSNLRSPRLYTFEEVQKIVIYQTTKMLAGQQRCNVDFVNLINKQPCKHDSVPTTSSSARPCKGTHEKKKMNKSQLNFVKILSTRFTVYNLNDKQKQILENAMDIILKQEMILKDYGMGDID